MNTFYESQLDRLQKNLVILPDKPEENPVRTLNALWRLVQGEPAAVERAAYSSLNPLSAGQEAALVELVNRRLSGMPLVYLTGRQEFMGIEMLVSPGALIPRKETEILARAVVAVSGESLAKEAGSARLIDVCTGVGNIAIFCAKQFPAATIHASDLTPEAIAAAKLNAEFCQTGSIDFRIGDMLAPFDTTEFRAGVNLISCNPPYISQGKLPAMAAEIANHEPPAAFDGGPFGISIISRLISEAPAILKSGGWLVFEIGAGQGSPLLKRIERISHYGPARVFEDSDGQIRALALQKL